MKEGRKTEVDIYTASDLSRSMVNFGQYARLVRTNHGGGNLGYILASTLAISRRVLITESGLRLIESMPCSTRKRANSG